jgi:hypothetical protein
MHSCGRVYHGGWSSKIMAAAKVTHARPFVQFRQEVLTTLSLTVRSRWHSAVRCIACEAITKACTRRNRQLSRRSVRSARSCTL